ncbi:hypothetical protein C1A50_3544 [Paenibacillus polymyxa]|nr:hypothetical protein C1A50_3544 [Paenibacillus polymyxa]
MISKKDLLLTSKQHTLVFCLYQHALYSYYRFFRLNNSYFAMYFHLKRK